jgi:starch-binding outer membrane protein, SusD/RagB family
MKKINIYILAFSLFIMSSCSDFLNTDPPTTISDSNFYRTTGDAYKALVGCYDGLQIIWSSGGLPVYAEVLSDNAFAGGGYYDGYGYSMLDEFDKSTSPSDQSMFGDNWANYYKAIYRCNVFLQKLDQIDWGTQPELRATYEAETKFIRAFLYFDMVRFWGHIPLLTEPTTEIVPQANPDDVYKLIAEDLKFATENLSALPYTSQPVSTHGRVTKWAAESLLARVFLYYTGYYAQSDLVGVVSKAQALAYVEDVIANSGHDLVEDFANLWPAASLDDYAGEDNKETVFAIKYTSTSDYSGNTDGNHWMIMFGIREQYSYPYGNGWGFGTVNPKLWNLYDDTDTRKVASVISIEDEGIDFTKLANQREYTGYYNKKYAPMVDENGVILPEKLYGNTSFQIGQFQDYVSIRYADVLLMAAELGSADAQAHFDKVRQRAYQENFSQIVVTQENIMKERQLEFACEGIRYWDLLRSGINVAANEIAESTSLLSGGVEDVKTITAAKIQETKGLQQIPYNQITLSGDKLEQNDGWK